MSLSLSLPLSCCCLGTRSCQPGKDKCKNNENRYKQQTRLGDLLNFLRESVSVLQLFFLSYLQLSSGIGNGVLCWWWIRTNCTNRNSPPKRRGPLAITLPPGGETGPLTCLFVCLCPLPVGDNAFAPRGGSHSEHAKGCARARTSAARCCRGNLC